MLFHVPLVKAGKQKSGYLRVDYLAIVVCSLLLHRKEKRHDYAEETEEED